MIRRVVRMSFQPDKVDTFLQNFNSNKEKIRAFEGCEHLELWRDIHKENVFFTYSHWLSEADLENYRSSELFGSVWAKTKILFDEKPMAWSLNQKLML